MHNKYDEIQEILSTYKEQIPQPKTEWPSEVSQGYECIKKQLYNDSLTVGWVKDRCHINDKCFSYRFCQYTGRYPKEYILYHRIRVAKKLLEDTNASVTEVALAVGFRSVSSFCNTFKEKTGKTPEHIRKQKEN